MLAAYWLLIAVGAIFIVYTAMIGQVIVFLVFGGNLSLVVVLCTLMAWLLHEGLGMFLIRNNYGVKELMMRKKK